MRIRIRRIAPGSTSAALISSLDLFAALAGSEISERHRIDGLDLSATLADDEPSARDEFVYYTAGGELDGIRQGEWKLLLKGNSVWGELRNQPEPMLFHITEDISESNNLAGKHPEKVAARTTRLKELDAEIAEIALPVWRKQP